MPPKGWRMDHGRRQTEGSNRRNWNLVTKIGKLGRRTGVHGPVEEMERLIQRQIHPPTK